MCLFINKKIHNTIISTAATAPKDITVFKVLRVSAVCDYHPFETISSLSYSGRYGYTTPNTNTEVVFNEADGTSLLVADDFLIKTGSTQITHGIHAWQTISRCLEANHVCFKAVIPAGTPFFVGTDGDVVSERLIIHRIWLKEEGDEYTIPKWQEELKASRLNKFDNIFERIDELTKALTELKNNDLNLLPVEYLNKDAFDILPRINSWDS